MNKTLLISVFLITLSTITSITSSPNELKSETLPTGGAHIEDAAFGYQLDIPPNWYVIAPPASDKDISEFNIALDEHYKNTNCKTILSPNDIKNSTDVRLFFISFSPEQSCSEIISTGVIMTLVGGNGYSQIPLSFVIDLINIVNLSDIPGIISASTQKTENGMLLAVIEYEPPHQELDCPRCAGKFFLFTTQNALVSIATIYEKEQLPNIENDIEILISSIKYFRPEEQ